jgi:hypothetical protein
VESQLTKKHNSEKENIELELIQSFPRNVKESVKQKRVHEIEKIKTEDIPKIITPDGTPETPATGAVGRFWKWSHQDVTRTPSGGARPRTWTWDKSTETRVRNMSIASTTSHDSASSHITDISPYINLIHSDTLRRPPRGTETQYRRQSSSEESMH